MSIRTMVLSGLLLGLVAGCQSTEKLGGKKSAQLSSGDNTFFRLAAMGDMTELQTSQVALQKAQNPEVRTFAQRMIDDHTGNRTKVTQLAQSKNYDMPKQLDSAHQKIVDNLRETQPGQQFDRAYMKAQVAAHQESIANYEGASKRAEDPDIKSFATSTLPLLQEHMRMAQALEQKVSGGR